MSFLVETGQTYDQLRGVALEGRGVVIEDPDVVWDVCVDIFNRYNGEYSEEMKPFVEFMAKNRVVVRLDVDRTRSWDHRKLGMPAMELGGSTAAYVEWSRAIRLRVDLQVHAPPVRRIGGRLPPCAP